MTGSGTQRHTWHYVLYVGREDGNLTTATLGLTPDAARPFAAVDTLGGAMVTFDDAHPISVQTTPPPGENEALQVCVRVCVRVCVCACVRVCACVCVCVCA